MAFKGRFEVVGGVAKDHFFYGESKQCLLDDGRELGILKREVPENIYVQTYDSRMDLLRAVIVANDALFFFDIALQPPRYSYYTYFYGPMFVNETTSAYSSVVEMLVSIRGQVLRYVGDGQCCGHHRQQAFLDSWRSTLEIMLRPPLMFEDFVFQHFRRRKGCILRAFDNFYLLGVSPTFKADLVELQKEVMQMRMVPKWRKSMMKYFRRDIIEKLKRVDRSKVKVELLHLLCILIYTLSFYYFALSFIKKRIAITSTEMLFQKLVDAMKKAKDNGTLPIHKEEESIATTSAAQKLFQKLVDAMKKAKAHKETLTKSSRLWNY